MASPFLQYIAEFMYARRYARRTIEAYVYWIKFFIIYHKKQHPSVLKEQDVETFLSFLVNQRNVDIMTPHEVLTSEFVG